MAETGSRPSACPGYADYVKQHLSPALVCGLTEIAELRPKDPIEFLGNYLRKYRSLHCSEEKANRKAEFNEHHPINSVCISEDEKIDQCDDEHLRVHRDCVNAFVDIGDIFEDSDLV